MERSYDYRFDESFFSIGDKEFLIGFFIVLGIIAFFLICIGVALYIMESIGLYKLAKNRGIDNPWLAWLPIGNMYILGSIVQMIKIGKFKIDNLKVWLPASQFIYIGVLLFLSIVFIIVAFIFPPFVLLFNIIVMVLALALTAFYYMTYYELFKIYRPENAVVFTILSVFFNFLLPIFVFVIRNDVPKTETVQN